MKRVFKSSVLIAGVLAICGQVWAQDAPYLAKGNLEGNVFIGASHGLDSWRWSSGGNIAYAVSRNWMPYAEYSYFPGIRRTLKDGSGTPLANFDRPASDFHVGVHYRIPSGQKAFVPYLVAGLGMIRWSQATAQTVVGPIPLASSVNFATNFGGGVRYYVFGESSGFRTEVKGYIPTGTPSGVSSGPFLKASIGFFYQFK